MRKNPFILLLLCIISVSCILMSAAGCTKSAAAVADDLAADTQSINSNAGDTKRTADVDLTVLSSTMVYAEVNRMMDRPDEYIGKTIRMQGPYYVSFYETTNQYYHYVLVEDAAACCVQGLEFIWDGEHVYPDDYPALADESQIEINGVFSSYDELGIVYYYLLTEDILVIN